MVVLRKRRERLMVVRLKNNHNKRRWLIEFDNDDKDQHMRYDAVVRYADKDANTFPNFGLPTRPIPLKKQSPITMKCLSWPINQTERAL